ncbi:MAG: hypothetical protein QF412_08525, partial [Planctomycetota bacterium]|nr:hypothetical protein [Planctomycetota bacterium]
MPFRFGNAVMESMDVAYARVETSIGGTDADGIAAQILSPLWFDKDPQVSFDAKNQRLLRAIAIAADIYNAAGQGSLSALHREVSSATAERCADEGINALTASFGVALIETALFHALCSATATNFHQALLADLPGLGEDFVSSLPSKPTPRMAVRHTVGLTDPVIDADIEEPLGDGLPQTLSDIIARHGVRYFKIKIARETEPTIERLCHIASLLDTTAGDYAVTLDANEQFEDMGEFHAFVQAFSEEPRLRSFWDRMLLFEQPVHRDEALSPEVAEPLREIGKARPVIIDESDATDETLMLALELGYAGCSAKS